MTDSRRRFNVRERVALFLAAGGRCTNCATPLSRGWHADHVIPWSAHGATDVVNGQALCPTCNLTKGSVMDDLREWQRIALERFAESSKPDFLAVATPGAGKTRFALEAAREMDAAFVIVVVPTTRLRYQWAEAAHRSDFYFISDFENGDGDPPADVEGVVVTYAAVASAPHIYRRLAGRARTLVILDEVHHCGESRRWGNAMRQAFDPATRRLLLSGTPFRSDSSLIPFVTYSKVDGQESVSRPDSSYSYTDGLREGVVREVEFSFFAGTARWMSAGDTLIEVSIKDAGDQEGTALTSLVMPTSEWSTAVLVEAHERLMRVRRDVPNAAALVIANSIQDAKAFAGALRALTGETVPVATSDDRQAAQIIDMFARSNQPWLVAVNMVSEGVDISRLIIGVYATTTRTDLFVRQAVGRFVRTTGEESDSQPAVVFMPSSSKLVELAHTIEVERDHVIEEDLIVVNEDDERGPGEGRRDGPDILPAVDGHHDQTVIGGEEFHPSELATAQRLADELGRSLSGIEVARALRLVGGVPETPVVDRTVAGRPKHKIRDDLRARNNHLVKQVAAVTGRQHSHIHHEVNQRVDGASSTKATVEGLEERHRLLLRMLEDG